MSAWSCVRCGIDGKIEIYGATIEYRYDIFGGPPPPYDMTGEDWTFLRTGTRSVNDNYWTLRVILVVPVVRKKGYTVYRYNCE